MPKGYRHLTYEQRCQICTLKKRGDSVDSISQELNVNKTTVYRELKRNSYEGRYIYFAAQIKTKRRRSKASSKTKKMTPELLMKIESKLLLQWSPVQISGRLKEEEGLLISHESIYRHIWKDKRNWGNLYKNLRHKGKKYKKRGSDKAGRGCIPNRVDIDKRPCIVDEKTRIGDFELDTIIGKNHQGVIVSIVDRASKYTMLMKVKSKQALGVADALITCLKPVKDRVHTLTADNGLEFSRHQEVSSTLKAEFYFAKPYHSRERGLNEHTNGLVRQYLPKKTNFNNVTQEDVKEIEKLLNERPGKSLNFKTPI